eukprot:g27327.t1
MAPALRSDNPMECTEWTRRRPFQTEVKREGWTKGFKRNLACMMTRGSTIVIFEDGCLQHGLSVLLPKQPRDAALAACGWCQQNLSTAQDAATNVNLYSELLILACRGHEESSTPQRLSPLLPFAMSGVEAFTAKSEMRLKQMLEKEGTVYVRGVEELASPGQFSRAGGAVAEGREYDDGTTWFPGWIWRMAICRTCGTHIGWRFESRSWNKSGGRGDASLFWGLIWRHGTHRRRVKAEASADLLLVSIFGGAVLVTMTCATDARPRSSMVPKLSTERVKVLQALRRLHRNHPRKHLPRHSRRCLPLPCRCGRRWHCGGAMLCIGREMRVLSTFGWLPCRERVQKFQVQGARRQLWPPLVEKAAAKLFGCYGALKGGTFAEALALFTGYPTQALRLYIPKMQRMERAQRRQDKMFEK